MRGKNPTRKQKFAIQEARLNPDNWLVIKNLGKQIQIKHRDSGKVKIILA